MLFFMRLVFLVALPASISVLTVVQLPPICVCNPAVPFDGSTFFCGGNSTLILIIIILPLQRNQRCSLTFWAYLVQEHC